MNIVATARTMYSAHIIITILLSMSAVLGEEVEASLLALLTTALIGSVLWIISALDAGGDLRILYAVTMLSFCALIIGIERFRRQSIQSEPDPHTCIKAEGKKKQR